MRGYSKDTLIFIALAAMMMWIADYYIFGGRQAIEAIKIQQEAPAPVVEARPEQPVVETPPVDVEPEAAPDYLGWGEDEDASYDGFNFFNEDEDWYEDWYMDSLDGEIEKTVAPQSAPLTVAPLKEGRPKIAIIIDDVGMNIAQSQAAIDLPAPITMAILPYAQRAPEFAVASKEKGHEIIIHTPMEAMNAPVSLGGMGLTTDMDIAAVTAMMEKITHSFDGFVGINNHMGSRFTGDRAAMERLMPYLKKHNLFFVDSKTIGSSVAETVAAEQGVANASRDIFLDHEETPQFVANALVQLEHVARRNGHAIAIGHPKEVTLSGLRAWIPTLQAKGIDLVPVSALLNRAPAEKIVTASAPALVTEPAPPTAEQPLLYQPSPEIRY